MKSELYKAITTIDITKLDDDDKLELLRIFMLTKNPLIYNHIAFIFSDLHYNKAIPYIIRKINHKSTFNDRGSLVFALDNLNSKKYFISFIKIICEQGYESRLMAFGIIEKYVSIISNQKKRSAFNILEKYRIKEEQSKNDKGENSRLHFIEKTEELLGCFSYKTKHR